MDEAAPEVVETAETKQPAETVRRGRPRPDEVVQRDEKVFEALTAPMTRKQVAESTGITESHAYLSLLRLRNSGRITHERTGAGHVWARAVEAPAAESAVAAEYSAQLYVTRRRAHHVLGASAVTS